jgi:hypothetical protein
MYVAQGVTLILHLMWIFTNLNLQAVSRKVLDIAVKRSGCIYRILERSRSRYFAAVINTDTGHVIGYETGRIVKRKCHFRIDGDVQLHFDEVECLNDDNKFGIDRHEMFVTPPRKDVAYNAFIAVAGSLNEDIWMIQDVDG